MFLRVNLGPMHLLKDFVNDVFVSDPKDYVRKENRISKIASKDLNKSSATATFQKNNEKKITLSKLILGIQLFQMTPNCML